MSKYRLKKWYPSLGDDFKEGDIVTYLPKFCEYVNKDNYVVPDVEVENNPEFWEKIEKPLFISEDQVPMYKDDIYWVPQHPYMGDRPIISFKGDEDKDYSDDDSKRFSTKEKAMEWVKKYQNRHKKVYSRKDINDALAKSLGSPDGDLTEVTFKPYKFKDILDL